jgi:uncharacterized protein YxjI
MRELEQLGRLIVSQRKEWGEILSGFEAHNKYIVFDEAGHEIYLAFEEGGSLLIRWWLRALRPFEIVLLTPNRQPVLRIRRPFRFYFHQVQIRDAAGRLLGTIRRRFSVLQRRYNVLDDQGHTVYELFGPLVHPWTFEIRRDEDVFGRITKRWSGLGKEVFTDADNFGVEWPEDWPVATKTLLLGAVFLIDFVHFENTGHD